jgi:hypothetical protein
VANSCGPWAKEIEREHEGTAVAADVKAMEAAKRCSEEGLARYSLRVPYMQTPISQIIFRFWGCNLDNMLRFLGMPSLKWNNMLTIVA